MVLQCNQIKTKFYKTSTTTTRLAIGRSVEVANCEEITKKGGN
jgi:hypothetical protein